MLGCGGQPDIEIASEAAGLEVGEAPTIAGFLTSPSRVPTQTPRPSSTPVPTLTPTPPINVETIVIFDEQFDPRWTVEAEGAFAEIVEETAYTGSKLLRVSPRQPINEISIITKPNNREGIERDKIISVSFYINSPVIELDPQNLSLTTQGSNDLTYWDESDRSANTGGGFAFLPTQFTFFEISAIPQDEWIRIEFSPEILEFDPNYINFTGFILSNTESELQPLLIDRIEILVEA